MPFKKTANAQLIDPIISAQDWGKMYGTKTFGQKNASFNKTAASGQSRYLLSHATIMASVAVEKEPFDYLVRPASASFFNGNDDAWTNAVLKLSYKSFVGAFNFFEHFQNSKASKGHILDAVLRKVTLGEDPEDWVYFCDILVATDLAHEELIEDIRSQRISTMSMGCVTSLVICSFCGARVTDQSSSCTHLQYNKGTFLVDDDGISRRVGELCGHSSLPNGGVTFVEASWVKQPAFAGAVSRNIVSQEWLGPATPYTHKAAAVDGLQKAASSKISYDLGEVLMSEDSRY